ncbi:MAG: hypothetical protein DWQ07_25890 [Chloroflexi bacterium]|nr:MAG: hypothetical protein DWQ07_25890 [Chloroflexota bacterium]
MKEHIELSDWREHERQAELDWIDQNQDALVEIALVELDEQGRGLVLVKTNEYTESLGHPMSFLPQSVVEELEVEEPIQHVREYDPQQEIVVMLAKSNGIERTYKIQTDQLDG